MSIFIENELNTQLPDGYEEIVTEIVEASLDFLECPYECEISVTFTDDEGIHALNKEYRDIDAPTDVLSFPLIDYEVPGEFSFCEADPLMYFNQDSGELMLGDIILNVNRIAKQAQDYGHTRRRELAFLTAHSMLHLAGYDHVDDEEREHMEQLQEEILTKKGYTRDNEKE
ncbi:MAG: rRNA maturation RNase YbeY [Wujia sp.]